MMKNVFQILFWGFLLANSISCSSDSRTVTGKVIKFDFERVESIKDSSWITIDDNKFIHSETARNLPEGQFLLPASKLKVGSLEGRVTINGRMIGRSIAKHLNKINQSKTESSKADYKIVDPHLLDIKGVLKIVKKDSSLIKVEAPKKYPVNIIKLK